MSPPGANAADLVAAREPASAADIGLAGNFARAGDVLVPAVAAPAVGAVAGVEGSPEVGLLEIEGSSTRERLQNGCDDGEASYVTEEFNPANHFSHSLHT